MEIFIGCLALWCVVMYFVLATNEMNYNEERRNLIGLCVKCKPIKKSFLHKIAALLTNKPEWF